MLDTRSSEFGAAILIDLFGRFLALSDFATDVSGIRMAAEYIASPSFSTEEESAEYIKQTVAFLRQMADEREAYDGKHFKGAAPNAVADNKAEV